MKGFIAWFKGKKTVIVSCLMFVYAALGLYLKFMTAEQAGTIILSALGLLGIRSAIAKV